MSARLRIFFVAYAAAVALGFGLLWAHEYEIGSTSIAPAQVPMGTTLEPIPGRALVVMSVHPHCPCTARGLDTLERLWTRRKADAAVDLAILLTIPRGEAPDFATGSTADRARSIPGAQVVVDVDGELSERFAAAASGQVAAYRASGELCFSGGLTVSRSHGGDSSGVDVLYALLRGEDPAEKTITTAVFGCSLQNP
ncbi:hypothetical protein ASA1KI_18300 [Opitutales bacterium ASA1]|uniref:hypothetical protein n=1 Tax=Congregicoccus parvus TaxID=3081749 RepID=UPI002B305E0D|nr:hypothetical protein ASA1KI_18300 [Opitutales bacterium ASA1]